MVNFLDQRIQNSTYWAGFALGALTTALVFLSLEKLFSDQGPYPPGVIPEDVVKAYNMGLKDAIRTNPPSLQLESVCLELWSERQPIGTLK